MAKQQPSTTPEPQPAPDAGPIDRPAAGGSYVRGPDGELIPRAEEPAPSETNKGN